MTFSTSFNKPYNTDSVADLNNAWAQNQQVEKDNAAIALKNAEQKDTDFSKLVNFSKTLGEWTTHIAEVNRKNELVDRHAKFLINEIITPEFLASYKQDVELKADGAKEDVKIQEAQLEAGYSKENTHYFRLNQGMKGVDIAGFKVKHAMSNYPSFMKELENPNKTWTIPGGKPFTVAGNDKLTKDEAEYAITSQLQEFLSQPDIREAPITMTLPYLESIRNNHKAWLNKKQIEIDFKMDERHGNDALAVFLSKGGDGDVDKRAGDLSFLLEEFRILRDENGNPYGYGGAMDLFSKKIYNLVASGQLEKQDALALNDIVISKGYKDSGKKYSKVYAARFGDPVWNKYIDAAHQVYRKEKDKIDKYNANIKEDEDIEAARNHIKTNNLSPADQVKYLNDVKKQWLEYDYYEHFSMKRIDALISQAEDSIINPEEIVQDEAKAKLDAVLQSGTASWELHRGLVGLLAPSQQGTYKSRIEQNEKDRQGEVYQRKIKQIATLVKNDVEIYGAGQETPVIDELTKLFRIEFIHLQNTEMKGIDPDLISAKAYMNVLENDYVKGIQTKEKGGTGRYIPAIKDNFDNVPPILAGSYPALQRSGHEKISEYQQKMQFERAYNTSLTRYGKEHILKTPEALYSKEYTERWDEDILNHHGIKHGAKKLGMPVIDYVNAIREANGQKPFIDKPLASEENKDSKLVSYYPGKALGASLRYLGNQESKDPLQYFSPIFSDAYNGLDPGLTALAIELTGQRSEIREGDTDALTEIVTKAEDDDDVKDYLISLNPPRAWASGVIPLNDERLLRPNLIG